MLLQFQKLFDRLRPAPEEWFKDLAEGGSSLEALPCESYSELVGYWKAAMNWTDFMDITLSSMLATVASTPLQGDQVWLRIIGIPGTAKTTLCDAFTTNKTYCKALSNLTGLHSGTKDSSGKDYSLIERLNRKTGILNEGDMLANAANRDKLMAELRDVFSGFTHNDYRNQDARSYEGLRITMIIAGTSKMRLMNSSALGDRFLDCVIYKRESEVAESKLVRGVLRSNRLRRISESNGSAVNQDSEEKILAKQKTAGYINWLRQNIIGELRQRNNTTTDEVHERMEVDCEMLGRLVANMRTRAGTGDEEATEKELHIRLSEQLIKAAQCTAVVLNRPFDREVMRRTAKLAWDTCYGTSFEVAKVMAVSNRPLDVPGIARMLRKNVEVVRKAMGVLYSLEAVRPEVPSAKSGATNRMNVYYRLTPATIVLLNRLKALQGPFGNNECLISS